MALGFERLKICELFAELLHCSNMSNLNTKITNSKDQPDDRVDNELKESNDTKDATDTNDQKYETGGSPKPNEPVSDTVHNADPSLMASSVGDQLKMKFIQHKVISTCIVSDTDCSGTC